MRANVLLCLTVLSAAACGDSPQSAARLHDVHACVELPPGATATSVINSLDDTPVVDGCFTVHAFASGPQLAIALSATGEPLGMAWLSPDRPLIDARSTAEVLAFQAIGGATAPPSLVPSVISQLAASPAIDPVAEAVADALRANPAAFSEEAPAVAAALARAAVELLDPANDAPAGVPKSVLVNPSEELSGVRLNTVGGNDQLTFQNRYRRAAYAFIDRVSVFDDDGEHASPAKLTELEVPSVQGLQGGIGTVGQILAATQQPGGLESSQDVAYVPRDAGPVQLENVPGKTKTRYRVVVVGPGISAGEEGALTDAQREKQIAVERTFFVKELILPLILQVLIPATDLNTYLDSDFGGGAVQDLITVITSTAPGIWDKAAGGDIKGALAAAYDGIVTSNTFRDQIFAIIADRFSDFRTAVAEARSARAVQVASQFAKLAGVVDAVLASGDAFAVARAVDLSSRAELWTVDVADTKVRLEPASATVQPGQERVLTTYVPSAGDGVVFEYRYSTAAEFGSLSDGLHEGASFTTTSQTVTYVAGSEEGSDEVRVEVFEIRLSERVPVGSASATVEVSNEEDNCAWLAEFCDKCDLGSNKDVCLDVVALGDSGQCQRAFEDRLAEACYPTSAYCEALRAACDTCTDPNEQINCIAASSSRYAYDDPALCENFDVAERAPSCTAP